MDIITGISTVLTTLKTGYELKKLAGNLDSEVEQGELKIQIRKLQENSIEVQEVLLKAKQEILDNRVIIQEKDKEIKDLEDLLRFKKKLIRQNDKYYETDENKNIIGEPFCPRCWESEQKPLHLIHIENNRFRCAESNCNFFERRTRSTSSMWRK